MKSSIPVSFQLLTLLLLTVLFTTNPNTLSAQLDRIRPAMPETEFTKKVPEAHRAFEDEAQWVSTPDSLDGLPGTSMWKIQNDTIAEYRFTSVAIPGPASEYPDADSSGIHEVKQMLDGFRKALEGSIGKPKQFRNAPFAEIGVSNLNYAWYAWWSFGKDDEVVIRLLTTLGSPNMANAPMMREKPTSKAYELEIDFTHRSPFGKEVYQLGLSTSEFFAAHPDLTDQHKAAKHVYIIDDSAIADNASWRFEFIGQKMTSFSYSAYVGQQYGGVNPDKGYAITSVKSEQLLDQGKKAFGTPDSLSDQLKKEYALPDMKGHHHINHLYTRWNTKSGDVILYMEEVGGGKDPNTFFHVAVQFGVYW